jgi:hypothetical protein
MPRKVKGSRYSQEPLKLLTEHSGFRTLDQDTFASYQKRKCKEKPTVATSAFFNSQVKLHDALTQEHFNTNRLRKPNRVHIDFKKIN